MDPLKVSEFIKKIRKENKLTQKKLADKYNVTYQAVSKWETGKNLPDVAILKQMSKDFNISVDDILDGKTDSIGSKISYRVILAIVLFSLIGMIIYLTIYINESYKFKTISTSCDVFEVKGSIAYDKKKSSIYISNVQYCGGDDDTTYAKIESVLYEKNRAQLTKVKGTKHSEKNTTLEGYLKDLEIKVDNYDKTCKVYESGSLVLEINATERTNRVITYKIPLELKEDCKKK